MHFLRGHLYFLLKVMFNYFPWVDETATDEQIVTISNREFTSTELWIKIAVNSRRCQLTACITIRAGRADQLAAKAYLAKTRLYQAMNKMNAQCNRY
jgi:hypothetical protein